ncbi:MAG: hypothetical protein ACYC1M_17205 [Armatimonadota bacterium]
MLFCLILGCLSVYFAEVVSNYAPTGLFSLWGIGVLLPLYGLHAVILGSLVHRKGTPHVASVVAAGVIFGLYEAYITKELWNPSHPFDPSQVVLGIHVPTLLSVVLFWHPLMAFLLPLWTADLLLLHTGQWRFWSPRWIRRMVLSPKHILWFAVLAGVVFGALNGVMQGAMDKSGLWHGTGLMVSVHSLLIVSLVWWYHKMAQGRRGSMRDMLPRGLELMACAVVLLIYYVLLGLTIRPEALPGLQGSISLWVLYAAFVWLMWRGSRWSYGAAQPTREHRVSAASVALLVFGGVVTLTSFGFAGSGAVTRNLVYVTFMFTGIIWSLWMLFQALRLAVAPHRIRLRPSRKSVYINRGAGNG